MIWTTRIGEVDGAGKGKEARVRMIGLVLIRDERVLEILSGRGMRSHLTATQQPSATFAQRRDQTAGSCLSVRTQMSCGELERPYVPMLFVPKFRNERPSTAFSGAVQRVMRCQEGQEGARETEREIGETPKKA